MKISEDVLQALALVEANEAAARITQTLDRSLYTRVNKVLEAIGGKWSRKYKRHIFAEGNASELINHVITFGEVTTPEDVGFFPTPEKLAHWLVELADVEEGDRVLEPSAGTGRIVQALRAAGASVWICERNEKMRVGFCRDKATHGGHVYHVDDFLDVDLTSQRFHKVVMNPPFCGVGRGDHLDHVAHALRMLRDGGTLVSVLPASIRFREDRRHREFRDLIAEHDGKIDDLPDGSFKESGTMVRTCVVTMRGRA